MTTNTSETHEFRADIAQLLDLIINAFYSSKDVFLRELISNASDAIDKRKHYDLTHQILDKQYKITITPNIEDNTLTIGDFGIGMSKDDLVNHLSTIAKSGTKEFIKQLSEKSDLIGQFGVGFYSAFLVADKVDVYSRKENEPVYKWSSTANQTFSIEEWGSDFKDDHGTEIVLHMKPDCLDYITETTLRKIVSTHSQFITYPIECLVEKEYEEDIPEEELIEEEEEENKVVEVEDDEEKEEKTPSEPKKKTRKVKRKEMEAINGEKPLWYQKSGEIEASQYENLYKVLSKDYQDPLYWRHFCTEGAFEFKGILYIPSHTPYNFMNDFTRDQRNVRLYVKKVLVLQNLPKDMMPDWMNFVAGVIDSSDMPLNVSREMLQQTKVLNAMKTQIKKQVMNMMNDLVDNEEKYNKFYEAFGKNIKLGIHEGEDALLTYLRIKCNTSDNVITLDQYVDSAKEGQKSFYYITGEDGDKAVMTKIYKDRGYSVLLFDEPIDEFMLQRVTKYKDFDFVSIAKDHKTPWETEEEKTEEEDSEIKEFCEWFKDSLGDATVESVKISKSLVNPEESSCIVLSSKFGWTGNMEKLMAAQPLQQNKNMSWMKGKKLVELNLQHGLIQKLKTEKSVNTAKLIYQSALITAGFPLDNPFEFSKLVQDVLV